MRHSWVDISRNVSICRACGTKRIREKQSGPWRSSVPNFRYEQPGKLIANETETIIAAPTWAAFTRQSAGKCDTVWPEGWEPNHRRDFYRKPDQEVLF